MNTAAALKTADAKPLQFPIPANVYAETVVSVKHYTDRLFAFRITRPQSLRFRSGEFVMIGLPNAEKPVYRAYSVASPSWDDEVEFFSIKVPDGPLTSELQKIQPGDTVLMRQKSTGTLVLDALTPGKRLFMISTGTGIAPFASLLRDPDTYERYEQVVLTHTCRDVAELAYGQELVANLENDPLIGELTHGRVTLYNSTTREESERMGRITALISSGKFFSDLGIDKFDPETDRIMICGSMHMLKDVKELAESLGFVEGSLNEPGTFVVERAFVG
ncbi:Ferredoxin--NADP reductase [Aminobacter sp. MSH1]|uniref:ferredoxin--NADP(+) reductase n=1 Tax=Aminobacter niigataensis TaxID=83265 RepID=A0ABR6L366_9HYPH|nr:MULTISPECIES: ferredoxin--NADP reductase [Aminobacter]AWC21018.1 Ferredoxin--NADP reductase [Aminobacter sp. MSH1]MBB4651175.1 ferredoxin--NADP+ reductase [Aminobacter niigataensis]